MNNQLIVWSNLSIEQKIDLIVAYFNNESLAAFVIDKAVVFVER